MTNLRTTPYDTDAVPPGLPYIIVNEASERFSFVGMKTILVIFMTEYLVDRAGFPATLSKDEAKAWYHAFAAAVYFFPLLGSVLADTFLGKYRTIYWLSIVYCLGHLALAIDGTSRGVLIGLTLIAIASGGIKPCVSAHLGDQLGPRNAHRLERLFTWFYFAITIGSVLSTLSTPWLLQRFGPHVAFGVPGALMLIATIVFRSGRSVFIHRPPGGVDFLRQTFSRAGFASVGKLFIIYAFVSIFWALYAQSGSAWVLQAKEMNRTLFGIEMLPAQVQAFEPLFTLALLPLSTYVLYPAITRAFEPTPYRRIGLGMGVMVVLFGLLAWIERRIGAGAAPSIGWHLLGFFLQSLAEVLVTVTCIEIAYKRAPAHMKSFVMAVFAFSVSLGNVFTSAVNFFIAGKDGSKLLEGSSYYLFFAGVMALGLALYALCARWLGDEPIQQ